MTLPATIDPEHAPNAPRGLSWRSTLRRHASLENLAALETAVDGAIAAKNRARERPLADYYKGRALLQEVTKSTIVAYRGSLALAHRVEIPGDSR